MNTYLAINNQTSLPLTVEWHSETGELVDSYGIPGFEKVDRDCSKLEGIHFATIKTEGKEYRHEFFPSEIGDWYLDENGIKEILNKIIPDLVVDKQKQMLVIPINNPLIKAFIQSMQQGADMKDLIPVGMPPQSQA